MNRFRHIDLFGKALAVSCMRYPWLVILLAIGFSAMCVSQLTGTIFSSNYEDYFSEDNPDLSNFRQFQQEFSKVDNTVFMVIPRTGNILSPDTLAAIKSLTDQAWKIPYVSRVDSLTNFQYSYASGDELVVEELVPDPLTLSEQDLNLLKQRATGEKVIYGQYLSKDLKAANVVVTNHYPDDQPYALPETTPAYRELIEQVEQQYPNVEIGLVGSSMYNQAFFEISYKEFQTLFPAMFVVLLLICYLAVRSIVAVISIVCVIFCSILACFGFMGYSGYLLDTFSGNVPIIVMVLAIADSIHLLISMRNGMRDGLNKYEAMQEAARINFVAISITSVTTIIGFLTLNFADANSLVNMGNMSAVGILAAWLTSMTLVPAVISILPIKVPEEGEHNKTTFVVWLAEFVINKRLVLIAVIGIVVVVASPMIKNLVFDEDWSRSLSKKTAFRQDLDRQKAHFSPYSVEYTMNAPGPGGVTDLEYLEYVASFAAWLEAHPYIQHVYSLPDILKRLNRNMHGDDPEYYVFPDSREKAAQYLLLYEMSLPYGLDLTNRVNFDKSSSRLTVQVGDVSSLPMREFYAETEQWLIEHTPEYMHTKPTGMFLMFNYLDLRSAISLSEGAIYAFIAIMLTLTLSFWSPWLGALSLLPNVLPLTTTFGIWALIHPQIDLGFIPIAPICLGIVVDNTVHFLSKYIRGKNEQGYDVKNAVRYSFNHVGQAISFNTLILVLGFSVLTLSNYKPNFHLGLLTAAAVSVAFIIDMLFFPALIIALDDFKQRFKSRW